MVTEQDPADASEPVNELAALDLEDNQEGESEEESEDHAEHDDEAQDAAHSDILQSKLEQQQVQDALLLQTVLLATKYVIKDKQLPMLVSTYWSLLQR